MKRFILGVDLDGVCADYQLGLHTFATQMGYNLPENPYPATWDLSSAGWFKDKEEFERVHQRAVASGMFVALKEMEGVSDALWQLNELEVHIRIVTHRLIGHGNHDVAVSDTVRWLQFPSLDGKPRIPFRDIAFLGSKEALDSDLHIDDAPHVIKAMKGAGHNVIIFDAPYNRDIDGQRARNWSEIVEIVKERLA